MKKRSSTVISRSRLLSLVIMSLVWEPFTWWHQPLSKTMEEYCWILNAQSACHCRSWIILCVCFKAEWMVRLTAIDPSHIILNVEETFKRNLWKIYSSFAWVNPMYKRILLLFNEIDITLSRPWCRQHIWKLFTWNHYLRAMSGLGSDTDKN